MAIKVFGIEVDNQKQAMRILESVGADQAGCRWMAPKMVHRLVMLEGVRPEQANIIKQEMLGKGGEAAVARGAVNCSVSETKVLLMGTLKQYSAFMAKLRLQPYGLSALAARIGAVLAGREGRLPGDLDCRGITVRVGERTLVMGILNVTPDSFSDGGRYLDCSSAVVRAKQMVADGADIIDLGGESTRPGHTPVDAGEEAARVIPVLKELVKELPVPISIDTSKAAVARQALESGAHMLNDQWALRADPAMAGLAAEYGAPVVLMHNQEGTGYGDLTGDMIAYFQESIGFALEAGMVRDKIIIDPGIGFGKTAGQNLEVLRRLRELRCLGLPVLIGTSRKSTIGKVLGLPVEQRVEGTAATVAVGIVNGADIVRVHDVKEMARVARMTDAIVRERGAFADG
ncbi:dihydropteroate synthase [Pelotomaculum terephthalicicum JT]|uniref:dihydropteroate synthase n=1 Tax=Pelotomaculum TaxID=191373 RepID=UPI0009C48A9C|nr:MULTISPECIES: dihydropteroate synthase [Pelotomaculum]MCG9968293.1 dihydropteroate synthase [Pelotomaculum terephthalicicum JT]OPX89502.1 MAG: Dihydropteroate synthase [Pelotomaculum sp. PtaB.Bin117]OPY63259.1 MAG: Dihydropteroate synthase [Pelotomaculum sp. PtaU1.Bin065]